MEELEVGKVPTEENRPGAADSGGQAVAGGGGEKGAAVLGWGSCGWGITLHSHDLEDTVRNPHAR